MLEQDFDEFRSVLDAVCSLLSRGAHQPNATNTALWFRSLSEYDLETVRWAFDAHVKDPQRGRFVPTPADIIGQIKDAKAETDGRPGVEEAWAMFPRRESDSAVWTDEARTAAGVVFGLIDDGDMIGARMAFKEAYTRAVQTARDAGKPVEWHVSLGHDTKGRDGVLAQAVEMGRITLGRAREFVPALQAPAPKMLELVGGAVRKIA